MCACASVDVWLLGRIVYTEGMVFVFVQEMLSFFVCRCNTQKYLCFFVYSRVIDSHILKFFAMFITTQSASVCSSLEMNQQS